MLLPTVALVALGMVPFFLSGFSPRVLFKVIESQEILIARIWGRPEAGLVAVKNLRAACSPPHEMLLSRFPWRHEVTSAAGCAKSKGRQVRPV